MKNQATTTPPSDPNAMLSTLQISRILIASGATTSRVTVNHWCARGVNVCGTKVRLAGERLGGRWLIRWGDFIAFRERCTLLASGEVERFETPTQRRKHNERVRKEIDELFDKALGRKPKPTAPAAKGS